MNEGGKVHETAEVIKGIVEAVPVYEDVVQPAAKEVGTALQTVAKTTYSPCSSIRTHLELRSNQGILKRNPCPKIRKCSSGTYRFAKSKCSWPGN